MQHTLRRGLHSLSSIARTHDDLPAFNAAYWVLTFLAAMMFNAGAFGVLIIGHMTLDVYKYRAIHGKKWGKVAEGVARENLVDTTLVLLSIAFGVYCHASLPLVAGLRGLMRTEIVMLNAVFQVFAKAHILHSTLALLSNIHKYMEEMHPRMGKNFTMLEIVSLVGFVTSLVLLILSPILLGLSNADIARLAAEMLIPWRL